MDNSEILTEPSLTCSYRAHKNEVNHVQFSPDSKNLVTCSNDQQVIFWEFKGNLEIHRSYRLSGHKDIVHCVDYSPNSDYFISVSRDKTACLWRLGPDNRPNLEPTIYNCHCSTIRSVGASPKGDYFCTGSDDKSVKIWSAFCKNKQTALLKGHMNWVRCCKYCPNDDQLVASCGDDSCLFVHDLRVYDGLPSKKVTKRGIKFTCLDWYPNNKNLVAISSHDSCVRIFDLRSDKALQYYNAHTGPVNHVEFHSSGNYLISSSDDGTSKIFDILEGRVLFTLQEHQGAVYCSAFAKDGKKFATVGKDSIVSLWTSNLIVENDESLIEDNDQDTERIARRLSTSSAKDSTDSKASNRLTANKKTSSRLSLDQTVDDCGQSFVNDEETSKDPSILIQILNQLDLLTESLSSLEKRVGKIEKRLDNHPSI